MTCPLGHFCVGGSASSCARSTYNPLVGQFLQTACEQCPTNAVTNGTAATSATDCVCIKGYYNSRSANETVACERCPVGSICIHEGTTLASLPLVAGYYRTSNASDDLRRCRDLGESSGCVGGTGAGEGPCKLGLEGPYCSLCTVRDSSRYYSSSESACLLCEGGVLWPLLIALGVLAAVLGLVGVLRYCRLRTPRRLQVLLRWLWQAGVVLSPEGCRRFVQETALSGLLLHPRVFLVGVYTRLSLRAKFKQMVSFYQVVTRISEVYELQLPARVRQLLEVFGVFNINVGVLVPLQCLGLGNYEDHLAFTMFSPIILAAAILLGFLAYPYLKSILALDCRWFRRGRPKEMLLAALPWLLLLTFIVSPMVSSSAFRAFSCEDFDNGRSFLRADYAIECYTENYTRVELLAWLGILLYPVGVSVLYAVLILASRRAILDDKPTSLSKALSFLVRDYEPAFMWWELLMLWRQLYLVGFALLIMTGTVEQLVISFLVALGYMLLVSVATPFKDEGDNYFGQACSFALTAVFLFLLVIKIGELTDSVRHAPNNHAFNLSLHLDPDAT